MRRKLPLILLALFTLFIVAGILMGEYSVVLEKAVTVCLGCIGIG